MITIGVHIEDSKLVIISENKTFHFDLLKDVDSNLKHEIDYIIKHNISLSMKNSRSSNKHDALQNLSSYYTWKNIRQQYKNKKLKIIAPTWNDEFPLPDGSYSVSDI